MLTKKIYINLLTKFYYKNLTNLYKNLNIVIFINLSFRLDQKLSLLYHIYICFFLSLMFGQTYNIIELKKDYRRLGIDKRYPLGVKLNFSDKLKFYTFIYYFNKWYYFNIFGELKSFFFNKNKGHFFGLKFPFLNLFYVFDYNLITLFLFNLNIPCFKLVVNNNSDKFENIALKNVYGFF